MTWKTLPSAPLCAGLLALLAAGSAAAQTSAPAAQPAAPAPAAPAAAAVPVDAPMGMPGARLYLGGAGINAAGTPGSGVVLGYENFNKFSRQTASFFGIEVLGAKQGQGFLPVFTFDYGLRFAPWPDGFLRPYLKAALGVSFLIILPIPSLSAGLGIGIPLGDHVVLDLALTGRYGFNLFNVDQPITVSALELGIGF